MRHAITLRVNGEPWPLEVQASDVLLETLRTQVGVKSPKPGCERGDCGSCTVLLDGRTVRSCLLLAVEADGREIVTVEGIHDEHLIRLQEQLHELSAFQCGYCAPGVVLALVELLRHHPSPSRHEIQETLSGNLCRCTGYEPIIQAVLAAARAAGTPAPQEV